MEYKIREKLFGANKASAIGTSLTLNDTIKYPINKLTIDGVCEQETTSGKNLLNIPNETITRSGINGTITNSNELTYNGTATGGYANITNNQECILPINEYTFSIDKETTNNERIVLYLEGGTRQVIIIEGGEKSKTFNSNGTNSTMRVSITNLIIGNSYNGKLKMQLESGSTATTYEPYTGGQPSPSPDYPQEIKTITDSLSVTSCNKNLLALPNETIISNGVTSTIKNNELTIKGTCTQNWFKISENLNLHLKAGTYTLSRTTKDAYRYNLGVTLASGTNKIIYGSTEYNTTFTIDEDFIINTLVSDSNIVGTSFDFKDYVQLEQGSQATSFEEHLQSQIIANLGNEFVGKLDDNYKDTLNVVYKDDGHYHLILNKMIGKIVLNGSEDIKGDWQNNTFPNYIQFYLTAKFLNNNYIDNKAKNCKCNNFISPGDSVWNYNNEGFAINKDIQNTLQFKLSKQRIKTIDDFKSWLSTHNVEVYYALETPYEVDLGIVDTLLSYDKITNIFSDSDLYPVINVKYYNGSLDISNYEFSIKEV